MQARALHGAEQPGNQGCIAGPNADLPDVLHEVRDVAGVNEVRPQRLSENLRNTLLRLLGNEVEELAVSDRRHSEAPRQAARYQLGVRRESRRRRRWVRLGHAAAHYAE